MFNHWFNCHEATRWVWHDVSPFTSVLVYLVHLWTKRSGRWVFYMGASIWFTLLSTTVACTRRDVDAIGPLAESPALDNINTRGYIHQYLLVTTHKEPCGIRNCVNQPANSVWLRNMKRLVCHNFIVGSNAAYAGDCASGPPASTSRLVEATVVDNNVNKIDAS